MNQLETFPVPAIIPAEDLVYLLSIINHSVHTDAQKWIHHIGMMDRTNPAFKIPGINLVFLELAKRKKIDNFNFDNPLDRWLTFLAEPEKLITMQLFDISVYPNLMKAVEILDRSNFSIEQQIAYDNHLFAVADINQTRIESFDKGYEEGRNQTLSILKDLQDGTLLHHEIATNHGVELQVVIQIADSLR